MIKTNFNSKTGILETVFEDKITLPDVIKYIRDTKENKNYPRVLKILTESRNSIFNFEINDLEIIMEENLKSLEKYDKIIDAIIINDPKNTVLSMLYSELAKTNKYIFEIFSTKTAAINWLNNK